MLTTEQMENLRTVGEGLGFLVMLVLGRHDVRDALRRVRKRVPLSIAETPEQETGDERIAVRRSELNVLVRKVGELVKKVDELVDLVQDHQNRLDEAEADKDTVSAALREVASVVREFRVEVAALKNAS